MASSAHNQERKQPRETRVVRQLVFWGSLLCATQVAVLPAKADPARCQDIVRRYEDIKPQISAIEVSLTLFSAVDANCTELVTELIEQGASVDARDRFGARPLSHAARFGNLPTVEVLLARGAPIDARNLAGATALYMAVENNRTGVAQRLIERGADVNLTARSGLTPVSAAAFRGNDGLVEALLARGASDREPDQTGKTPIVYAAAAARVDVVKRLLARNIDVNARYPNDLTLLMWASGPDEAAPEAEAIKVVSLLLDAGAHIDDRDNRGRTALMTAAEGGRAGIVDVLLAHGADRSLKDNSGKRAGDLTVLTALREKLAAQ
jgi:ankyrin repeat protein